MHLLCKRDAKLPFQSKVCDSQSCILIVLPLLTIKLLTAILLTNYNFSSLSAHCFAQLLLITRERFVELSKQNFIFSKLLNTVKTTRIVFILSDIDSVVPATLVLRTPRFQECSRLLGNLAQIITFTIGGLPFSSTFTSKLCCLSNCEVSLKLLRCNEFNIELVSVCLRIDLPRNGHRHIHVIPMYWIMQKELQWLRNEETHFLYESERLSLLSHGRSILSGQI